MSKTLKRLAEAIQKSFLDTGQEATPVPSAGAEDIEEDEQQYNAEFRETLVSLERLLHSTEEPAAITMESLKAVCHFHDADWAGILVLDRTAEMWAPAMWYEPGVGEMGPTLFNDVEYFEHFPRWVHALKTGIPVIIRDVESDGIPQEEAEQYRRLATRSVIGAPFGDRPTGFLVVRNPKRYPGIPDLVQMLAFVTLSSYYLKELQEGMQMMQEKPDGRSTDPAAITIRLFGVPEIITATGQINEEAYHSESGWKLLTFLALRKSPVPSRSIAEQLWPDKDQDLKSNYIRQIIYRFKSKLAFLQPNELFVNTASGYCLNPELNIRCDTDEFDRLCNLAENTTDKQKKIELLKKTVALYHGEIYAKFSHEHWLIGDAAHYQIKYLKASSELMEMLSSTHDYPAVQEVALQAIRAIPGNVNACYWMTIAMYQLGGRDAAEKIVSSMRPKLTEEEFKELKERLEDKIK